MKKTKSISFIFSAALLALSLPVVAKADSKTLSIKNGNVYYDCRGTATPAPASLAIDLNSVKFLNDSFFVDRKKVYYVYEDIMTQSCGFESLAAADPASFKIIDNEYQQDRNSVYFSEYFKGGPYVERIKGADSRSFTVLKDGYAKDRRRVYFGFYNEVVILNNAHPRTFTVLKNGYAKDSRQAYYSGLVLANANPSRLKLLSADYATSGRFVYFKNDLMKGADAGSFAVMKEKTGSGSNYAMDKNNAYLEGQKAGAIAVKIKNAAIYNNFKGKVAIRELYNDLYYFSPLGKAYFYLKDSATLFDLIRRQGLAISDRNLAKIPVGGSCPADNAACDRSAAHNAAFANSRKGRILIQVQRKSEAWYVNPTDGKRYFLGRPDEALAVMKSLAVGITRNDFDSLTK